MSFEDIIREIETVRARINNHPAYYSKVHDRARNWLIKESNRHSLAIENIKMISSGNYPKQSKKNKRKKKNKQNPEYENLKKGWDHLTKYGLCISSLSSLGHIVEPIGHHYSNFRMVQNQVGHSSPPEKEKVPYLIENLLYRIDGININPVLKSIEFHLDFLYIHPYEDGNGRTSRLIQNFILKSNGYSPCLVPEDERKEYIKILRGAILDRENKISFFDKPSNNELDLRSYLSEKILNTSLNLEREISKQKIYEIEISCNKGVTPGFYHKMSNIIRSYNYADNESGVTVTISQKGQCPKLRIEGDITRKRLENLLEKQVVKGRNGLKNYTIKTIYNGRKWHVD